MTVRLQSVSPLATFELAMVLTNGESRRFDVKPYLDKGIFKALHPAYFCRVQGQPRFVQWAQGQDLSLDTLMARSLTMAVG